MQIAFCTALSLVVIELFQFNSNQFKAMYHSVILLLFKSFFENTL